MSISLVNAELEVTKGSVKYKVKQTTVGAASRNGELITDSEYIEQITAIALPPTTFGAATKPVLSATWSSLIWATVGCSLHGDGR